MRGRNDHYTLTPADRRPSRRLERYLKGRSAFQPRRHRQVLAAQEFRVEQLGLIARAVVGEHGHDGVAGPQLAGEPDRTGDVDTRRSTEAEALVLQEVEDDR